MAHSPSDLHVETAQRCLTFVLETKLDKLVFESGGLELFGYSDAS